MVVQRHDYPVPPVVPARSEATPQHRIAQLLGESVIACRVRERLRARGALKEPAAGPDRWREDRHETRSVRRTVEQPAPARCLVTEHGR